MKSIHIAAVVLLALVMMMTSAAAFAATEPNSKTLEESISYEDKGIRITIDRWCYAFDRSELRFFLANVYVDDPSQLQTAFAYEEYSEHGREATSTIAARHDAVLAINGDYYNYKTHVNLVIRNGVLYRDRKSTYDQLLIYADGRFEAIPVSLYESGHGQEYIDEGVMQSLSFGPLLVYDGERVRLPSKYVIATGDSVREPRTGIGWVDGTHYVVLVADGRRDGWSDRGMTLQEMQQVFKEQGCRIAYNLDGGGSSTMVLNGELVNMTSGSRERDVSDILYFTALP